MAKLPALYLMTGDWMKNPELRRCSPGARGVWIDMLCLMFDCEKRGVLATGDSAWSPREIANVVSGDTNLVVSHIEELLQKHVARMDDSSGIKTGVASAIYSGRMLRDEKERQRWMQSKQNSRKPIVSRDCPGDVPPIVPDLSRPSSSSLSSSKQKTKTTTPQAAFVLPDWVPPDSWEAWLEMRKKKRATPTMYAMRLAIERLVTLKASGSEPRAVLDQSTERNWTGLFEVAQSPIGTNYANSGKENRYESKRDRIFRESMEKDPDSDNG